MKTALGISFFDNIAEIPRCLDPIYRWFDYIIAINGRYSNYESDHDYSNDGSEELILKYPNAIVDRCCAFQPYKRQRYLDIASELKCDWLLVIDTDEYVHPQHDNWLQFWCNLLKISKKYPDYKLFKIKMWIPPTWKKAWNIARTNSWKPYVRIHKDPGSQRYCMDYHYLFCPKDVTDEQIIKGEPFMFNPFKNAIEGVRFIVDSTLRTPERLKINDEWAFRNIHDEHRREYYLRCDYQYKTLKHEPLNENELFFYDKNGRIVGKKSLNR